MLESINNDHTQCWNITVSEMMAIQKGGRIEISYAGNMDGISRNENINQYGIWGA